LLVREGERASEPRAIACGYWGRQEACPLYVLAVLALAAAAVAVLGVESRAMPWLLAAVGLSMTAHILSALRMWAGR
jgi:hypothetical protein